MLDAYLAGAVGGAITSMIVIYIITSYYKWKMRKNMRSQKEEYTKEANRRKHRFALEQDKKRKKKLAQEAAIQESKAQAVDLAGQLAGKKKKRRK